MSDMGDYTNIGDYADMLGKIDAALDVDPVFGPNLAGVPGLEDGDLGLDDLPLGERIFRNAHIRPILAKFPGATEQMNPPVYLIKAGDFVFACLGIPRDKAVEIAAALAADGLGDSEIAEIDALEYVTHADAFVPVSAVVNEGAG